MADFLLELSQNPNARRVIRGLGLPVSLPPVLKRAKGPWEARPLDDERVLIGARGDGALAGPLAEALTQAGAELGLVGSGHDVEAWRGPGEAYGRPVEAFESAVPDEWKPRALVFDGTGIEDAASLRSLYDFFHPLVSRLAPNGRVVVLGRPPESRESAQAAAAQSALEGFARSVARELGRKGSTAHLIVVEPGAESRIAGPLRFLLSDRSAFLSGQPFRISTKASSKDEEDAWVRPLEGKVALVTGAARGIGEATARLLAAEGAKVVCLDRPADDAAVSKLAREIDGGVLLVDLSDADAGRRIASELETRYGGVDIVVHNAGITRDRTLGKMKPEGWDQAVDVNLAAVIRVNGELLRGVLRDGGRIVCLSSVAGIAGNVGQTNYSASKAGIVGYVRHLSAELADRGITVNAIAPGFIETRLTAAIPLMIREAGRRLSNLSQGGLPEDVGQAITFLATPGANGLTGQVVRVCGGALIGA